MKLQDLLDRGHTGEYRHPAGLVAQIRLGRISVRRLRDDKPVDLISEVRCGPDGTWTVPCAHLFDDKWVRHTSLTITEAVRNAGPGDVFRDDKCRVAVRGYKHSTVVYRAATEPVWLDEEAR